MVGFCISSALLLLIVSLSIVETAAVTGNATRITDLKLKLNANGTANALETVGMSAQNLPPHTVNRSATELETSANAIPAWIDSWSAPQEFVDWFPYYLAGHDMDGASVYVFEIGNWKPQAAVRASPGGLENMKELASKLIEQGVYRILRDGLDNNGQGVALIVDYDGFNLVNYADATTIQFLIRLWSHFTMVDPVTGTPFSTTHFSSTIVHFAAENFIRLAKPFWGTILDKCEVFGPQKSKWLHHILRKIPRSELPPWYGGDDSWRPLWILAGLVVAQVLEPR